jgi:cell wall-associated NlpC family hydrolase
MNPLEIVAIARETLGTPYQHQQRICGMAMDCAGPVAYVANRLGMPFDDITNYGRMPDPARAKEILDKNFDRVTKAEMQPGDIAWIRFEFEPQHFGILGDYHLGGLSLIHAYDGAGLDKVIEHRIDQQWYARIVSVWRFRQVTE